MKRLSQSELNKILKNHWKFVNNEPNGCKADFCDCDLTGCSELALTGADLAYVNFRNANLKGMDLSGANLNYTDLRGANFTNVDLCGAWMMHAKVDGVNFTNTDFYKAYVNGTDFTTAINMDKSINLGKIHFARWFTPPGNYADLPVMKQVEALHQSCERRVREC